MLPSTDAKERSERRLIGRHDGQQIWPQHTAPRLLSSPITTSKNKFQARHSIVGER